MVLSYLAYGLLPARAAEVWFTPNPESPDFLDLFKKPSLWSKARSQVSVIKLGPQQSGSNNPTSTNTLAELKAVNAFRLLSQWGIKLAIEVPALKPWDCDGQKAAKMTLQLVENIRRAGGEVSYLSMDEPYVSGIVFCKDTMEAAAAKTARYMKEIERNEPQLQVGDIEVYPYFRIDQLKAWLTALEKNGVRPANFHLDVNVHRFDLSPDINLTADLRSLRAYLNSRKIPFGIIFWSGYNPEPTDRAYFDRTMSWTKRVHAAIGIPDQVIIQSWVIRSSPRCTDTDPSCYPNKLHCTSEDPAGCGRPTVPINLPENAPNVYSHSRLINEILAILNH